MLIAALAVTSHAAGLYWHSADIELDTRRHLEATMSSATVEGSVSLSVKMAVIVGSIGDRG
jgi:hypothetical protein